MASVIVPKPLMIGSSLSKKHSTEAALFNKQKIAIKSSMIWLSVLVLYSVLNICDFQKAMRQNPN